ncbi:response regulator [Martelella soudanensis]|uniref:response regulator n=1 Tax=unclassified Martelella TaxID=2629616 RepID=UPI0015DE92CB|nr:MULTISPECIES: response regulator transcription factor [unclassified Martelella]
MTGQTILIADDHPLFRSALKQAIGGMATSYAVVEAGDFESAQQAARDNPEAELMLFDLAMPGVSGLSGLITLRAEFSSLPIVVISGSDDDDTIRRSLALGASGFISKSVGIEELRNGIRMVLSGEVYTPQNFGGGEESDPDIADMLQRLQTLTPQQSRVLRMLCEGLLNKQIAYELGVSEATVKAHVSAILLKLNVDSRTQAVIQLGKVNMAMVA